MYYEPGAYIDLTYLNKKPKKKGVFESHLNGADEPQLFDIGTHIVFIPAIN